MKKLHTRKGFNERYNYYLAEGYTYKEAYKKVCQDAEKETPGWVLYPTYTSFINYRFSKKKTKVYMKTTMPAIYQNEGYWLRYFINRTHTTTNKEAWEKTEADLQNELPGMVRFEDYQSFRNALHKIITSYIHLS